MSGDKIFLDTNIVLYLLNGDRTLIPLLENKELIISFITQLELLSYKGLDDNGQLLIKEFLSECSIIDINAEIKEIAITLRRKYSLKLPDCIIMASSLYMKVPIISADKQFAKVEILELILYQK